MMPIAFTAVLVLFNILAMASSLSCVARYAVRSAANPFSLVISSGSVVDFSFGTTTKNKAAIVNAANEGCLGGGGVDGAISDAGGPALLADRMKLPSSDEGVRCPTGSAVITGPGDYGDLGVSHVIHAVGPNYMEFNDDLSEGDKLLSGAYSTSMEKAKEAKLEAVAFSLISSGIFRGKHSKKDVLKIGVEAICGFDGYDELQEVHLCAYNAAEESLLGDICDELGLAKE